MCFAICIVYKIISHLFTKLKKGILRSRFIISYQTPAPYKGYHYNFIHISGTLLLHTVQLHEYGPNGIKLIYVRTSWIAKIIVLDMQLHFL